MDSAGGASHSGGSCGGRGETVGVRREGRVGRDNMGRNARYSMHLKLKK